MTPDSVDKQDASDEWLYKVLVNLWQGDKFYTKYPESGAAEATDKRVKEAAQAITQRIEEAVAAARLDAFDELITAMENSERPNADWYREPFECVHDLARQLQERSKA